MPHPVAVDFPTLLQLSPLRIQAYARETVVAEKTEAMVSLGIANSRMKDFFDIWFLSRRFEFEGGRLSAAMRATFDRRNTAIPPATPLALTDAFANDPLKAQQWTAFVRKARLRLHPPSLALLTHELAGFLVPPIRAMRARNDFVGRWRPPGPWSSSPVT